ncbi:MAG: DUF3320 domain-containing protein [Bacteroidetes bacterium]|nr:DUF3320 domain-containing protein [Bacteroidota bacterium]MBU1114392.1 DUF3320 domain-containing protein [Bacteroidota bacterium]MBU1798313.1 DUF3320 domain-containing protein [Bacteroidota bacterium]
MHNNARTMIQEQGVNILYLALGFMHWYDSDTSDTARKAPLILIPVTLERLSAKERFSVNYSGEDVGTNLSLEEKLKAQYSIKLPEIESFEDLDIEEYFRKVQKKIGGQTNWVVKNDEIVLGFFSFGKFLMYKDLDRNIWSEDNLPENHDILQALLGDGFKNITSILADDTKIDEIIEPDKTNQIVDADSTQILAILDVNAGHNLVIQGPPGTGKSQTITNIISEALGQGKKVLFVAEKMAALEVVKRRLDNTGLGDAVLELHSHKVNKRIVIDELARTLELGAPNHLDNTAEMETLVEYRNALNNYSQIINSPIMKSGITFIKAIGKMQFIGDVYLSWPKIDFSKMRDWEKHDFISIRNRVADLEKRLHTIGIPEENSFWGSDKKILFQDEKEKIKNSINENLTNTNSLKERIEKLIQGLSLDLPLNNKEAIVLCNTCESMISAPVLRDIDVSNPYWKDNAQEIAMAVESGKIITNLLSKYNQYLLDHAWDADILYERQQILQYRSKWWRILSKKYRTSRSTIKSLCKTNTSVEPHFQLELADSIISYKKHFKVYSEHEKIGHSILKSYWKGLRTDWDKINYIIKLIHELYNEIASGNIQEKVLENLTDSKSNLNINDVNDLKHFINAQMQDLIQLENELEISGNNSDEYKSINKLDYKDQIDRLTEWFDNFSDFENLVHYNTLREEFKYLNLKFILEVSDSWKEASINLVNCFDASWYNGLLQEAYKTNKELYQFNRDSHELKIKRFRELDTLLFKYNQVKIISKHWDELPNLSQSGGELTILKKEINKKRGLKPIRQLMSEAGNVIQAIKPVFMMGPLSIANFISPQSVKFDLIIFDEASQVKPIDAFGAILRGKQVVVVGDSKQLPPTSFFESMATDNSDFDEDSAITSDMESILGLFKAQNAPDRMLRWHYRSRHHSLIAVSNNEFYENKLVVFPSPGNNSEAKGLRFKYFPDTFYERGTSRTNPGEAKEVAIAIMEHAKNKKNLTLGVVAFSTAQRDAIEYSLEILRRQDSSCEDYYGMHQEEPFFIKNLENVQGDERDVIIISIGYGKTKDGYLSMGFGPLNRDGGERRLNVLISRAKRSCYVFTNFFGEDIDLNKTSAKGVVSLRNFLIYAKTRVLEIPFSTYQDTDSPFEDEVIKAISKHGYKLEPQVGSAGFRIDIGVVDNEYAGRYLLGIECDGATYHSAQSARDRDRLRQQVLENLGWRIYRIWSTDWFRDSEKETRRAIEAIERAKVYWSGKSAEEKRENTLKNPTNNNLLARTEIKKIETQTHIYEEAKVNITLRHKILQECTPFELKDIIIEIVNQEGPISEKLVVKRVVNGSGASRTGSILTRVIENAIAYVVREKTVRKSKEFLYPIDYHPVVRDRANADSIVKSIENLPSEEVEFAIISAIKTSYSIETDELIRNVSDTLGIKRVTEQFNAFMKTIIKTMVQTGQLSNEGNFLRIKELN